MHGEGKKMRKEKIEGNGEKVKEKKEKEAEYKEGICKVFTSAPVICHATIDFLP